jgi:hypothetical protein
MLDDTQRRVLTGFLCECWHEVEYEGDSFCQHCEEHYTHAQNRTFITAQDMMDLKERLVEKGMWPKFWYYSHEVWLPIIDINKFRPDGFVTFINWLLNPPRFCKLLADLLKKEE